MLGSCNTTPSSSFWKLMKPVQTLWTPLSHAACVPALRICPGNAPLEYSLSSQHITVVSAPYSIRDPYIKDWPSCVRRNCLGRCQTQAVTSSYFPTYPSLQWPLLGRVQTPAVSFKSPPLYYIGKSLSTERAELECSTGTQVFGQVKTLSESHFCVLNGG